jgi:hypothetical protein
MFLLVTSGNGVVQSKSYKEVLRWL